ncbi:hypothetical protein Tco_1473764 [Tanacetum coccineum]
MTFCVCVVSFISKIFEKFQDQNGGVACWTFLMSSTYTSIEGPIFSLKILLTKGWIHGDLLVEKASMKLRNLWPDDESTSLSITIGQALLRSVNVYPHSRLPIGLLNHDHVGNSINLEEKKRSSLADGLLAKIEALALRKLAMFEWDPLFSP